MTSLDEMLGAFGEPGAEGGALTLAVDLEISEREAADGATRQVDVTRSERCETCEGTGSATPDARRIACAACRGTGGAESRNGFFIVKSMCESCHGQKTVLARPCASCHGDGTVPAVAQISVTIPPGTPHGAAIRVPGAGGLTSGTAATRRDLFIFVLVAGHEDTRGIAMVPDLPAEPGLPRAQVVSGAGPGPGRSWIGFAIAFAVVLAFCALVLR